MCPDTAFFFLMLVLGNQTQILTVLTELLSSAPSLCFLEIVLIIVVALLVNTCPGTLGTRKFMVVYKCRSLMVISMKQNQK